MVDSSQPSASSPAGPKQRTINSFFTPKSGTTPKPPKAAPKAAPKPKVPEHEEDAEEEEAPVRPTRRRTAAKRTLEVEDEDAEDNDDDLYSLPAAPVKTPNKRMRRSMEPEDAYEPEPEPADEQPARFLAPPKAAKTAGKKASKEPSATALQYRYNPMQTQDGAMDVDKPVEPAGRARQKEVLREQFKKKLGRIDIVRQAVAEEEGGDEAAEDEEEPEEEGPIAKRFGRGGKAAAGKGGAAKKSKLTPLEKQVVDIKLANPDTVLVVEVGYKFRFFGEDARIASQHLSIMCIPGKFRFDNHPSEAGYDKFASASIPVPRLHVHVKRLVAAGYKVGVVRQLETAALKAAGDNRNAPFQRKLTNLYTKGTYIDDIEGLEGDLSSGAGSGGAPNTGFLLCITEKPGGGTGTDEKARVGIVAVQPSTGDVIYDEFDDGFMRSEIETRLLHIAPCEFLIAGELTKATEKLVSHISGSTTTVLGEKVRVERVEMHKGSEAEAATHISKFYADRVASADGGDETAGKNKLLDSVLDLPRLVKLCLSSMINHLAAYGLEHVFDLTKYFQPFSARSHMLLNGNTLSSLEIYRNATDYTTKGSLFWTLDRTKTKFGRRLLRKWVGRPLLDQAQLEARIAAVEEIRDGSNPKIETLKTLLSRISYDLEKGLIRIYYGKCTRPELLTVLQTMLRIASAFKAVDEPEEVGFKSSILNSAIAALPGIREDVQGYLNLFNHVAAGKDDKYDFFKDSDDYQAIAEQKLGIAAVESDLEAHKDEIAKALKRKQVTYVTVSGVEYLVEVTNDKAALARVPASWVKISGTKKLSRFHTPTVLAMLRERDQYRESLALECDKSFSLLLASIASHYQSLRDCITSLATLDCLCSLAAVSAQPGYTKPAFVATPTIHIAGGRHPMVEQLLLNTYVPNDTRLAAAAHRAMLITGPNMGGKSSYVRQIALICIMAQIGSYVPASSATLGLLDAVFTRMGAFDNMLAGESTFMVELSETSDILKQAGPRSLVILDELGRGTSTHDGVAIAHAVFEHVVTQLRSLLLFVTHYPLLGRFAAVYPEAVVNAHMAFTEAGDGGDGEEVTFLYSVAEGVAARSYGLNVARLAGLPRGVIETAAVKSRELEGVLREREAVRWARALAGAGAEVDVDALLGSLEYLKC
ncbi:muts domain V-domain-containing protein [Geopyxis carbonaria]|nr:muts domain V-domain-containing protein [Geopyxis carbonaria]